MQVGETITRNNNVEQAMDCRDATAKVFRFFDFILKLHFETIVRQKLKEVT